MENNMQTSEENKSVCRSRKFLRQNPLFLQNKVILRTAAIAVKLFVYDGTGFWLCAKRFSQGKLNDWPKSVCATIMMVVLLQGLSAQMPS